jgi:hypothetical protein
MPNAARIADESNAGKKKARALALEAAEKGQVGNRTSATTGMAQAVHRHTQQAQACSIIFFFCIHLAVEKSYRSTGATPGTLTAPRAR